MALQTGKARDIPEGYIRLTRSEAAKFQMNLIRNLTSKWNRFFIEYGPGISAALTSLTAVHIHQVYREAVNLGLHKRIHTYAPVVVVPSFSVLLLHTKFVRDDIIIQKWSCPFCYHLRSSLMQTFFGLAVPISIASSTSFILARRWKFYDVPPINHWKAIWNFFLTKSKPHFNLFGYYVIGHLIAGAMIAHMEALQNNDFNNNFEALARSYDQKKKLKNDAFKTQEN